MKKYDIVLKSVSLILVMVLVGLWNTHNVQANDLKVDQGRIATGATFNGHAAVYKAYTTHQDARGYTSATLKQLGGATVWVQRTTLPSTREEKTGTRLNMLEISVFTFGYGLYEHGYVGINPAY